jgi:hypothetical protein
MMLILTFALLTSPFAYELKEGPSLEMSLATTFVEAEDPQDLSPTLRLSWMKPSETDSWITGEVWGTASYFPSRTQPSWKQSSGVNIAFYESYYPYFFRVAFGPGLELRENDWNLMGALRGGLGQSFATDWILTGDLEGRWTKRSAREGGWSNPILLSLGLMHIF